MNEIVLFLEAERIRVERLYSKSKHAVGFNNKQGLANWYTAQLGEQNYCCKYCETSIFTIQALIKAGLLKTRKVRGEGVRGPVLEIDKVRNEDGYYPQNCVLACYYCNNDKSYTVDGEAYKTYFGNARKKFFEYLSTLLPSSKSKVD